MIALAVAVALLAASIALSPRIASGRVVRELRAIAEQEADERRQAGIRAGFDAGWHTTSRRAK